MATTFVSSHLASSPGNIKPSTENRIYTVRHFSGDVTHGVFVGFESESERNGTSVTWYVHTDDLPRMAAEFARVADLCRGRYEEEQDRREAAVEAVADGLRGHLSEAVAGDETVPHEATDIEGADLALPIAAGGA